MEKIKQCAIDAALVAGKILKEGFGADFNINYKEGINNLVTDIDIAAEKAIISYIKSVFPNHVFLAEESGSQGDIDANTIRWVIDPLDGTVNFAHSIPIFSTSIAAEKNGEIICGVIYNPMLDELFVAVKGQGATLNSKPIQVSACHDIKKAVCVTGFPYSIPDRTEQMLEIFCNLIKNGNPVRRLGSAALDLAYVAAGRFDFFWEELLNPWDVAAGTLLVSEAGGKLSQYNGDKYNIFAPSILATNGKIFDDCLKLMR